jgi:hypothetical protein
MRYDADGRVTEVGARTRTIPPAIRRALLHRDHGCRFPGCGLRLCDAHHVEHWADGGRTDIDNLLLLCRHHHRLLHEGGYTVTVTGRSVAFHRPDGRTIEPCPGPPAKRPRSLPPRRPDACVPRSNDRMRLDLAVDAMLTFAPIASGEPPGV